MYSTGAAHGFVIFDQSETDDSEQTYKSRESGSDRPTLLVRFRGGSAPGGPVASTSTPPPAATATSPAAPSATSTSTRTPAPTNTSVPPTQTPPPGNPCGQITLTATADAWFEQSSTSNKGDDSSLKVQSKEGSNAFRALVRFALPALPAGCTLDWSELRLYAEGAKPGRVIQVQRAAAAWSEMSVNWSNQPARTGPVSSAASGSDEGWRVWSVTQQVAEMFGPGQAHGFVVFDSAENDDSEQVYRSREKDSGRPTLVIQLRPQ
jgi:hypothetical protein